MGLPEYVSGRYQLGSVVRTKLAQSYEVPAARPIFIVRSKGASIGSKSSSLGNQYVFGIFPVTRLYLQHGEEGALLELIIDALAEQGYSPRLVSEEALPSVFESFGAAVVIRPDLKDLSVNAYDMLFLRRMSVTGDVVLEAVRPGGIVSGRIAEPIAGEQYSARGHAPVLAALIEKSLQQSLMNAMGKLNLRSGQISRTFGIANGAVPVDTAVLDYPVMVAAYPAEFGQAIGDSYGFKGSPPYSKENVERIIQRGIERGFDRENIATVSIADASDRARDQPSANQGSLWYLSSAISSLEVHGGAKDSPIESVSLVMDFEARTQANAVSSTSFRGQCAVEVKPSAKDDGYWVKGLEDATTNMILETFKLLRSTGESTICRLSVPN